MSIKALGIANHYTSSKKQPYQAMAGPQYRGHLPWFGCSVCQINRLSIGSVPGSENPKTMLKKSTSKGVVELK